MARKQPSPFSIALADAAAIGHVNTGLDLYRRFEALGNQNSGPLDFNRAMELGIPAVTNMALGLELLLKVFHFQVSGEYPRGHDIAKLGSSFPTKELERLRSNYRVLYDDPSVSKGVEFRFTGGPKGHRPKEWVVPATETFDQAIAYVGPMYVQWRYIYEDFQDEVEIGVTFSPLYFCAMATHRCIREHEGKSRTTLSDGSGDA